jgi:hypothetical protein
MAPKKTSASERETFIASSSGRGIFGPGGCFEQFVERSSATHKRLRVAYQENPTISD